MTKRTIRSPVCLFLLSLIIGCSGPSNVPHSTISELQDDWTRKRAYEIAPALGETYDAYHALPPGTPRGDAFSRLGVAVNLLSSEMTGEDCLRMLGAPDLWGNLAPHLIGLVYFYEDEKGRRSELRVEVTEDGKKIESVGWNRAGVNRYSTLRY